MPTPWTTADIRDQHGRTVVITGANTGVGFQAARTLAELHATVVLACRDPHRAEGAIARIRADLPDARVSALPLDLASLASVRAAAERLHAEHDRLDLLINNAGVMWAPRGTTADGFETHFGTNHLGHFAFTGRVLDLLTGVPGSRVVTVTSPAHRSARLDFADLRSTGRYRPVAVYGKSKLANVLFAYELQRRLVASGAPTISLAAHPGGARTELNRTMPALFRGSSWGIWRPLTHDAAHGSLPILRAATDPHAHGGEYYGPSGPGEFRGRPVRRQSSAGSHDTQAQRRLWTVSEELTGVRFDLAETAGSVTGGELTNG